MLEIKDAPLSALDNPADFMRVGCVARRLSISRKRVYQLIEGRRLMAVKFGPRQTRILRESVDDYIRLLLIDEPADIAESDS